MGEASELLTKQAASPQESSVDSLIPDQDDGNPKQSSGHPDLADGSKQKSASTCSSPAAPDILTAHASTGNVSLVPSLESKDFLKDLMEFPLWGSVYNRIR